MWPRATNSTGVLEARRIGKAEGGCPFDWIASSARRPSHEPPRPRRDLCFPQRSSRESIGTRNSLPWFSIEKKQVFARGAPFSSKNTCAAVVTRSLASVSWPAPCASPHSTGRSPRKPGAKLGSVEFLLGRELLNTAAAVFAEDDNGHGFGPGRLRQFMRNERYGGSLNGSTKKEDANGGGCAVHLFETSRFSPAGLGAAQA